MFKSSLRILLIAVLIGNYMARAQYEVVGNLITNFDDYGYGAVSDISDDGNRIIVSSVDAGSLIGGVKVFEFNTQTNKWEQLGQNLKGTQSFETFGSTVSISGDGGTIAIGSNYRGGAVFTYRLHNGSWTLIRSGILQNGENFWSFGDRVILNTDGSKLIVSGILTEKDERNHSAVMLFKLDKANDTWNQIGDMLEGDVGYLGADIAANTDFNRIVVGDGEGNVKVYDISADDRGDIWTQRGNTISYKFNNYIYSRYGTQLAITDDGNYIVIGEPADLASLAGDDETTLPGYVQAYKFNGKNWVTDGSKLTYGKGLNNDNFGRSIALDPKGKRLIVAKPKTAGDGLSNATFYIYNYNGNDWIISEDMLTINLRDTKHGVSVNMTPDKSRIVVSGEGGVVGIYQEPKESILGLDNRLNNSDTPTTLYPNPVNNGFTIALDDTAYKGLENRQCVVEIIDNLGRAVLTKNNISMGNSYYIPTEHLHAGIYFVQIKDIKGSQVYVKRIAKR